MRRPRSLCLESPERLYYPHPLRCNASQLFRVVHPALSTTFAKHHDASLRDLAHSLSVLLTSFFVIQQFSDGYGGFHVGGLAACKQQFRREGFEVPGWRRRTCVRRAMALASPSSFHQVSVRPCSRRSWPAPGCLRCGWSVGEAWVPSGVSSCKSLLRGMGASVHQCHGEGLQHPSVEPTGWSETSGGG